MRNIPEIFPDRPELPVKLVKAQRPRVMSEEAWQVIQANLKQLLLVAHKHVNGLNGGEELGEEARDVLHNAIVSMLCAKNQPPASREQLILWACTIIRNEARNLYARTARAQYMLQANLETTTFLNLPDVLHERQAWLEEKVQTLSHKQQHVVWMRANGYTHQQIADYLGMGGMVSCKVALHAATLKLKALAQRTRQ